MAALRSGLGALALIAPQAGWVQEPAAPVTPPSPWFSNAPAAAPGARPAESTLWETGAGKSYLIPALEIIGFDFLLNRFDHAYFGCCDFDVSSSSIRRNLRSSWVTDNDPFRVNQLGHPYQGSMYHGFARSAGLSYWESLGYTFAGSILWEIAGETTLPSKNDQVAS